MILMRRRLFLFIPAVFLYAALAAGAQQPDLSKIGPAVGAPVPEFSGVDQFGKTQTLQSVAGSEGTMLVFFRSADW